MHYAQYVHIIIPLCFTYTAFTCVRNRSLNYLENVRFRREIAVSIKYDENRTPITHIFTLNVCIYIG